MPFFVLFFLLYAVFNLRKSMTTVTSFQICKQVHKFDLWVQMVFDNQLLRSLSLTSQGSHHLTLWWVQMVFVNQLLRSLSLASQGSHHLTLWWVQMVFVNQLLRSLSLTSQGSHHLTLWWVQMDSNHRPHAYQACALTSWAMNPFCRAFARNKKFNPCGLVEVSGIEPLTPCLQGRCSTSWATPPRKAISL